MSKIFKGIALEQGISDATKELLKIEVADKDYRVLSVTSWASEFSSEDAFEFAYGFSDKVIFRSDTEISVFVREEEYACLFLLYPYINSITMRFVGNDPDLHNSVLDNIRETFPKMEISEGESSVRFWYNSPTGPKSFIRRLAVPSWDTIKENYDGRTSEGVERLLNGFDPEIEGRLVLFSGPPGTGKTYAIRSLCHSFTLDEDVEYNIHYITDPDQFFRDYSYMNTVVGTENLFSEEGVEGSKDILIMEDVGEFLRPDARNEVGNNLGRFLNFLDGFLGQGLNMMCLLTTNEELGQLHDAVVRHGRCGMRLGFPTLSVEQANQWLENHGSEHRVEGRTALSDLFYMISEHSGSDDRGSDIGFRVHVEDN